MFLWRCWALWLCILSVLATGCAHFPTPFLPDSWEARTASLDVLSDDPDRGRLHILVVYADLGCAHAALRLYSPVSGPLFWDPGGTYATQGFADSRRERDLVVDPIPTLGEYLTWRHHLPTRKIEIFEFELSEERSEELWKILRRGAGAGNSGGSFDTKSLGGFCSLAISRFLEEFGTGVIQLDAAFLPHNLARAIYESGIDQVYIYEHDELLWLAPVRPMHGGG